MSGKIKNKLKSKKGETITETMVSVLIAAAAMILFASMITSSQRILKKSESIMDAYYTGMSSMEEAMAKGGSVKNGTAAFVSGATSQKYRIGYKHGIDLSGDIAIQYASNHGDGDTDLQRFTVSEYTSKN